MMECVLVFGGDVFKRIMDIGFSTKQITNISINICVPSVSVVGGRNNKFKSLRITVFPVGGAAAGTILVVLII